MTITPSSGSDLEALSGGLLILRLSLGLALASHGAQKLFGWFGGSGLAGATREMERFGFYPGLPFASAAALTELTAGLLVALGLLGPVGPALMISPMLVAGITVRPHGFYAYNRGFELPFLYAVGGLVLALTGFGAFSLDTVLDLTALGSPVLALGAVILSVIGGLAMLALRRASAGGVR
jgi:putative oxidoreductase